MKNLVIEQRNKDVISRPYLTEAEEFNHLEDMGVIAAQEEKERMEKIESKWLKSRKMEEEIMHINSARQWE